MAENMIIIGAGLAGLSAAASFARKNIPCRLVSVQPSERAQSVLAAGGINGALNTMGEDDTTENHYQDTLAAGVWIADPEAVRGLTEHAPEVIRHLAAIGVPFNTENNTIVQRNFGGQKKKRTAYARSSTGKIIMTAMIDEVRKYEAAGLVERYPEHEFLSLRLSEDGQTCLGADVRDMFSGEILEMRGPVILAFGGMNGMFPGKTTGTTANTGDAAARVFAQGVRFSNLEMIQFHPTTMGIAGKRCLVSEAARGEGGRLFVRRNGENWYFMDEKYPEFGSLMPRDVVSREMYFVVRREDCEDQVYLDMTHLPQKTWEKKLPDLRKEIMHYLNLDPKKDYIPVDPGIHYFMGGIDVDVRHRTNLAGLYAAGECCSQYHGANRLGGNSMLGALYGGQTAALAAAEESGMPGRTGTRGAGAAAVTGRRWSVRESDPCFANALCDILTKSLGIVRNGDEIRSGLKDLERLASERRKSGRMSRTEEARVSLAEAMLLSALFRRESRGAHYRADYPEHDDAYRGSTIAEYAPDGVKISLREVGSLENSL